MRWYCITYPPRGLATLPVHSTGRKKGVLCRSAQLSDAARSTLAALRKATADSVTVRMRRVAGNPFDPTGLGAPLWLGGPLQCLRDERVDALAAAGGSSSTRGCSSGD